MELATFGAGCFWESEFTFKQIEGVINTSVGFMGGNVKNPSYKDVYTDKTGHAEVVQIEFNPTIVTYKSLLELFFDCHNPTSVNKQGDDIGTRYRSVIFYHNEMQKHTSENSIKLIEKKHLFSKKIVTKIERADDFFLAEDYHQNYYEKNSIRSCQID